MISDLSKNRGSPSFQHSSHSTEEEKSSNTLRVPKGGHFRFWPFGCHCVLSEHFVSEVPGIKASFTTFTVATQSPCPISLSKHFPHVVLLELLFFPLKLKLVLKLQKKTRIARYSANALYIYKCQGGGWDSSPVTGRLCGQHAKNLTQNGLCGRYCIDADSLTRRHRTQEMQVHTATRTISSLVCAHSSWLCFVFQEYSHRSPLRATEKEVGSPSRGFSFSYLIICDPNQLVFSLY